MSSDSIYFYGKKLREARRKNGLKQEDLAFKVGCSQSEISDYEREEKGCTLERVHKILETLGASWDGFVRGSEEEPSKNKAIHTLLVDPTRKWQADRFPPSALLRAEYCVVPFFGRKDIISDIEQWCEIDQSVAVRLYTSAGGMGKTRLFIEICSLLRSQDWNTGFLGSRAVETPPDLLNTLIEGQDRLFIVIDYAETRRRELVEILKRAANKSGEGILRIILLARAATEWWWMLQGEKGGLGDLIKGPATQHIFLPPLAKSTDEQQMVFHEAMESFAVVLGKEMVLPTSLDLTASYFDRVLFIHIYALATILGESPPEEDGLLDFVLYREKAFWNDGVTAAGIHNFVGPPIMQAAAVATLAGSAADRDEAIQLIRRAPLLRGQPMAVLEKVAELLHRLYPGEKWLQGVQPDLLGEHLVARTLEEDNNLLELFHRC